MGYAYALVGPDLRTAVYERGHKQGLVVLADNPWDDSGLRLIRFLDVLGTNLPTHGENGLQQIIIEGDGFRFALDEPGFET